MGSLRAFAVVLTLVPALASAQPQPSAKDKQQASDLVKKAIAKSQAGDHQAAANLYDDAYKIIPNPLLLSNMGSEYQQMEKKVEALKYFCKYLEADPNGQNATYATAQARTLYIELGGVSTVQDGELCKPIVKPHAEPPPPPPTPTQPEVKPEPTPPVAGPVDHGPKSKSSPLRLAGVAVSVIGAGAFGAGIYFGLQAKKISDDITNHDPSQPWPADIKDQEAKGKSDETKQIGLMIGGGVAIAAGVAMIVLGAPKEEHETGVSYVTPVATPDSVGFAAAGRF